MTASDTQPPTKLGKPKPPAQDKFGAVGIGGAGVIIVLCCVLVPLLVAGGALGVLGAIVGNPLAIVVAAILLGTGIAVFVARRRADGDACCPPSDTPR